MRAVIYDPDARANLRLADVDEPVVADSEALIEVRATALNFGEVHFIDRMRKPGEVPGWDAAGVVLQAAADGSARRHPSRRF
jgi:NADPH2:quinone reductase